VTHDAEDVDGYDERLAARSADLDGAALGDGHGAGAWL
jgi:hypothetical protein